MFLPRTALARAIVPATRPAGASVPCPVLSEPLNLNLPIVACTGCPLSCLATQAARACGVLSTCSLVGHRIDNSTWPSHSSPVLDTNPSELGPDCREELLLYRTTTEGSGQRSSSPQQGLHILSRFPFNNDQNISLIHQMHNCVVRTRRLPTISGSNWPQLLNANLHGPSLRSFCSNAGSERVEVRCGSAGHVTIDLFNVLEDPCSNEPLFVHLPPFPLQNGSVPRLPAFLRKHAVASINYRWRPFTDPPGGDARPVALHWPTPVHDTSFAFAWLLENLSPPKNTRRDIYVYGSYLGGSLGASLALTESHAHARFGVRGFTCYNGIYNWTMFLPDHRVNKPARRMKSTVIGSSSFPTDSHLHRLQENLPALFDMPSNLFDPFASPSLFFHSPGLLVPPSFFMTAEHAALIDNMTSDSDGELAYKPVKAPRKSHLVFPPRQSTLKIPDTLLLFDSAPLPTANPSTKSRGTRPTRRAKSLGNSFQAQADEMAQLMRRSIDLVEMKDRSKWDEDVHNRADEALRRVQVLDAGPERDDLELSEAGHEAVASWLASRT